MDDPTSGFYTMANLRKRYGGCSRSTIYRRIKDSGFPKPKAFGTKGSKLLWSKDEVHAWDAIHLPQLAEKEPNGNGWDVKVAKALLEGYIPRRKHTVREVAARAKPTRPTSRKPKKKK